MLFLAAAPSLGMAVIDRWLKVKMFIRVCNGELPSGLRGYSPISIRITVISKRPVS